MKKLVPVLIVIASIFSAAMAMGQNKVYVPLVLDQITDGSAFQTEIRVLKKGEAGRSDFSYLFIPANQSGANFDREAAATGSVANHATTRLENLVDFGQIGYMEFDVPDDVVVTSRIVSTAPDGATRLGTEIPAIAGMVGGRVAALAGLQSNGEDRYTDFFLLNLSEKDNQCEVDVSKRGGANVLSQVLSIAPQTLVPFRDVFDLLGETGADMSIGVTCAETFHAFAMVHYISTAETLYVVDSKAVGISGGGGDGGGGGGGGGVSGCSPNAEVVREGVVHRATAGNERGTINIPFTGNEVFSKIVVELDVTISGWNNRSSDLHNVFWLQNTDTWRGNLYGYLNLKGPNQNRVKNSTNVGLPAGDFAIIEANKAFETGKTYHVYYEYNTQVGEITIIFTRKDNGQEFWRGTGGTTVNNIRVKAPNFFIKFGHGAHEAGPEVPTYGWTYSNVCVDFQ